MLNADGSVSHKIQYRGYPPSAICIDETQQLLVVGAQDGALKVYTMEPDTPIDRNSYVFHTCFEGVYDGTGYPIEQGADLP